LTNTGGGGGRAAQNGRGTRSGSLPGIILSRLIYSQKSNAKISTGLFFERIALLFPAGLPTRRVSDVLCRPPVPSAGITQNMDGVKFFGCARPAYRDYSHRDEQKKVPKKGARHLFLL